MATTTTSKSLPTKVPNVIDKIKNTLTDRFKQGLGIAKNLASNTTKVIGKATNGIMRSVDYGWGLTPEQGKRVNKILGDRTGLTPKQQRDTLYSAIDRVRNESNTTSTPTTTPYK